MSTSTQYETTVVPVVGRPDTLNSLQERGFALLRRLAPVMLRGSLGLVFIWFGALKLLGDSPVKALIAATLPWFSIGIVMPVLGWVEVVIGVSLLIGWPRRLTLLALAGHLTGTFLAFIMAPRMMVQHGNPLLLTADGEFVLKNLVLITAGLILLAGAGPGRSRTGQGGS